MSFPECFPSPLPYETLYSFLCRYHVRSCNATDRATLLQLFDKCRSLHTTVLSPFPLRFAGTWTDSFKGFSRESLIKEHTAFPFYQSFHSCSNTSRSSYAADRFFMAMYNHCATESKKLRYCPRCVQSQWECFGVSYWQILPQINGYEICPIHKEIIRETDISHWDIRYSFYPASNVLGKYKPHDNLVLLRCIEKHWDDFMGMTDDISYLFHYSYYGFHLGSKLQKALQFDLLPVDHHWRKKLLVDPILSCCADETCMNYLGLIVGSTVELISLMNYLPALLQMRICRAMFGSIEYFCTARI